MTGRQRILSIHYEKAAVDEVNEYNVSEIILVDVGANEKAIFRK